MSSSTCWCFPRPCSSNTTGEGGKAPAVSVRGVRHGQMRTAATMMTTLPPMSPPMITFPPPQPHTPPPKKRQKITPKRQNPPPKKTEKTTQTLKSFCAPPPRFPHSAQTLSRTDLISGNGRPSLKPMYPPITYKVLPMQAEAHPARSYPMGPARGGAGGGGGGGGDGSGGGGGGCV